ncbi:MAG: LysM peptidoglycan-binding domain-containing protein [Deltaproteobacteria bacterium]|nr:LysM peptidoglycan-binding domain-containing protein [Deltaproteobacteria bacterium]
MSLVLGCSTVSDDEMARLREETYALEAELAMAKREASVLDRALTSVYQERDQLVDRIARATAESQGLEAPEPKNPSPGSLDNASSLGALNVAPGGAAAGSLDPGVQGAGRIYRAVSGDTLSSISSRFGVSVAVLLELNPQISRRSSQMVWVGEAIKLTQ